ncbi:MAG: serine hydrolase domain-containing protein, partial [Bacteroidota bacterium]
MPILFLLASLVAGDPDFEILIERLSAAVEREMETHGIPAVSFALVLEGETVWTGGFGEARDGVPATGETVYRVASISKLLNAVAVLQAVEAGELSLDQPLGRALGAYGIRAHPDLEGTTLRHLLSHTSGV